MAALNEGLRILVVEDNPGDFVLIQEYMLEGLDHPDIMNAKTFAETVKYIEKQRPFDAILLDLSLPDSKGEKLVNDVVDLSGFTPVIVLTGYENKEFGLKTLSMGIADYLLKDELSSFILEKSISYSIERNRINRSLRQSEKQYKDIFNLSPQPMWLFDLNSLQFLEVNEAAIRSYGYRRDEFLSMTIEDIRPSEEIPKLNQAIHTIHNTENTFFEAVSRHVKKNGEVIDVSVKASKLVENGREMNMVLAEDITQKLKAERALKLSEQRFKAMIQDGSDIIGILDEDLNYTYISPTAASVFKIDPDEFLGMYALEAVHYDDRERVLKSVKKLNSQDRIFIDPYRLVDKEGEWHWIETIVTNLLDEPSIDGYVVNSRDVTKQMERESKLKELSLVASKTNDIVIITDPDEKITWVNQAFEKLTEYSLEECMGKIPGDFLQGPDTNPETKKRIKQAVQTKQSIEEVILNYSKSGKSYWLEMSISPIFDEDGNCTHFIAIERDVTEKIEQEIALKESLERYDIVSKATSDTIWDLNLKEDVMVYNENIHNMFGYNKTEVHDTGEWWRNNLHPEDRPYVNQKIREVITYGIERFQLDYRFKTAEGSYKYIYDRAFLMKDETGEPVRMIGAMQDVTQDAEEQERLKLLESVITNTNESVVITEAKPSDKPGRRILYVNEAFSTLTGYDRKEVMGKSLHFLNGPKTDQNEREKLRRSMEKYQPCEAEFINYKKSGEEFHIHSSYVPVANSEGEYTHWVAIGHDVTEERLQEKELKASLQEKETLLAEIHHRVKNNLAVVSSLIQMQAMSSQDQVLSNQLMEGVLRIKSMAAIHEQLYQAKSFSKLQFSSGLENLIGNIVDTLQTDTDIELEFNLHPVELNINQGVPCSLLVNEVLSNILKHGFEGRKNGLIEVNLSQRDDVVELNIRDNGVGLPEDFGNKTRKTMGLELIDLLTQQLEGINEFISSDQGTTFTLSFEKTDIKGVGSAFIT